MHKRIFASSSPLNHLFAGGVSGQPEVDTDATEPVGDPMDELGLELVPIPCRLSTPLRLMA